VKICVLDDYESVAESIVDWSRIEGNHTLTFSTSPLLDEKQLIEFLKPFEIIVIMRERTTFSKEILSQLPALHFISTSGTRNAGIDFHTCAELGIKVSGTRSGGLPVVELAWTQIFALLRNINSARDSMNAGLWQPRLGNEIAGKTIGLVGLGKTGNKMAIIAKAFGAKVVAWSPNLTQEKCEGAGVRYVSKEELFQMSDVISTHLVLSERTRNIVDRKALELMKPSALFINTSRGELCDYVALAELCGEGKIAGAGLDVFPNEPLASESKLRNCANILLTPHIGYVTEENFELWYTDAIENINSFRAGSPIRLLDA